MSNWLLSLAAATARLLPLPVKQAIYRQPALARLIRGGLNRAAPQGLVQVEVAAGGLRNMRLLLNLQTEKDYWLGTYEPELQASLLELVQPGLVVYDVGANIGYISLLFASQVGVQGQVYAFEPLPANLERLRANLELNEAGVRVTVVPAAVIDASRPVTFLVGPSSGMGKAAGSAGRQEVTYDRSVEVDGLSLDDFSFVQDHPLPQIVKIDIEGGEVLALPGMRRLLREARPTILLELHGPQAAQVAWEALVQAGYQICRMAPGFPAVGSIRELDWKAYLVGLPLA